MNLYIHKYLTLATPEKTVTLVNYLKKDNKNLNYLQLISEEFST